MSPAKAERHRRSRQLARARRIAKGKYQRRTWCAVANVSPSQAGLLERGEIRMGLLRAGHWCDSVPRFETGPFPAGYGELVSEHRDEWPEICPSCALAWARRYGRSWTEDEGPPRDPLAYRARQRASGETLLEALVWSSVKSVRVLAAQILREYFDEDLPF